MIDLAGIAGMASRREGLIACDIEICAEPMGNAKASQLVVVLGCFLRDYVIDDELFEKQGLFAVETSLAMRLPKGLSVNI